MLEGSTYPMLDTEALLLYGQRHPGKPAPISFADMDKASYIRGVAAFYELGLVDMR